MFRPTVPPNDMKDECYPPLITPSNCTLDYAPPPPPPGVWDTSNHYVQFFISIVASRMPAWACNWLPPYTFAEHYFCSFIGSPTSLHVWTTRHDNIYVDNLKNREVSKIPSRDFLCEKFYIYAATFSLSN